MTDEQVKKGLECCTKDGTIKELCKKQCPYYEDCHTRGEDDKRIYSDALVLINRLEEENKELRALCRKKSNGMKLDEWVKMIVRADYGVKFVDMDVIKEQIRKQTAKEIINDLFNACDGSPNDCVEPDHIFYLAKKYDVEVE